MDDQHRQRLVEIYEGAALAIMMHDAMEEDGKRLHEEFENAKANGEVPELPESLDLKCLNLIDKAIARESRRERMRLFLRASAKVAVVVLLLIGLSTVTVLSVEALRVPVLNFLLDPSGKFQTVFLDREEKFSAEENNVIGRLLNNIPQGYQHQKTEYYTDSAGLIAYSDNEGNSITLDFVPTNGAANYDAEDTNYSPITINNCAAAFLEKDGYSMLWVDEDSNTAYTLFANGLDKNTFMELAYILIG